MVQVGITPQPRRGLNTSVVSSTLDCRHNSFSDTLIAAVQAPLHDGPISFTCYPNLTLSLTDPWLPHTLKIKVQTHGFDMLEGSHNVTLLWILKHNFIPTCETPVTVWICVLPVFVLWQATCTQGYQCVWGWVPWWMDSQLVDLSSSSLALDLLSKVDIERRQQG